MGRIPEMWQAVFPRYSSYAFLLFTIIFVGISIRYGVNTWQYLQLQPPSKFSSIDAMNLIHLAFFLILAILSIILYAMSISFRKQAYFHQQYPRLAATLIGCALAIVILGFVELTAFLYISTTPYNQLILEKDVSFERNSYFGYIYPRSTVIKEKAVIADKTIYDVSYTTDRNGGRFIPEYYKKKVNAEQFLVLWGCSFLFGMGVEDHETTAHLIATQSPNYKVYNLAIPGQCPSHMLARIEDGGCLKSIRENSGIFVYGFIPSHFKRVEASMPKLTHMGFYVPSYKLDSSLTPIYEGLFAYAHPWKIVAYELLSYDYLHKALGKPLSYTVSNDTILLTARILIESRNQLLQQFPKSTFYIMLYPYDEGENENIAKLSSFLEKDGINILDFNGLYKIGTQEYTFANEGHPTPAAHQKIAEKMINELKLDLI